MDKNSFLNGVPFKGTIKSEIFRFRPDANLLPIIQTHFLPIGTQIIDSDVMKKLGMEGTLEISRGGNLFQYYAVVEKVTEKSFSLFFTGINKMQFEKIIFSEIIPITQKGKEVTNEGQS